MARSTGRHRSVPLALLTTAVLTASLAACGGDDGGGSDSQDVSGANEASDTGVTETGIKLGGHFPLTGVAAPGYSEIPTGIKAYFDWVNEKGGVNGRDVEYLYRDDAYDPTKTSQVVNQLVLEDEVFAIVGGLGTPTHSAVLDFLNGEGVPDLFVASGSRLWGEDPKTNPETFGWQTDYESEGKIIGKYISEEFPNAKVGLFLQDDDFGEDGEKGIRQFVDDQVVAAERYTPGNTNVGPQIAALKAAGADFVVGFNVPSYTALSQLTALQLGYRPQWFYSNVGSDPTLVGSLLKNFSQGKVGDASLLDGALTTDYLPTVDQPDDPWVKQFQAIWDAEGDGSPLTNYRIYGMSMAYTTVQALQAAGKNPTRESLVDAIEQAGGDWEGPVLAPFRYSDKTHMGTSGMSISRIKGTGTEEVEPVQTTDLGKAAIKPYDGKESAPPKDGIPDEQPVD